MKKKDKQFPSFTFKLDKKLKKNLAIHPFSSPVKAILIDKEGNWIETQIISYEATENYNTTPIFKVRIIYK